MRHSELHRSLRLAALAGLLSTGVACAHGAAARTDPQVATAGQLDSLRGVAAKRRVSSGLQAVDITDADRDRFTRVEQMIQAKFSGVEVSANGAGYHLHIRGAESFSSGTEPLLIVDGTTMNSVSDLSSVNPRDVVRIEVLKDAAASLYGVRGGNGVIVVTTYRIR